MKAENTPRPAIDNARRVRIGELTQVGVTMSEKEMKAVSGAQPIPSYACGSTRRIDEWQI